MKPHPRFVLSLALVALTSALPSALHAAGATVPFRTFLPSTFVYANGATLVTTAGSTRPNLHAESIEHGYAKLSNTTDYVQVPVPASSGTYVAPINRVTVRYSVRFSDSQNHAGSWTLSVHANSGGSYH